MANLVCIHAHTLVVGKMEHFLNILNLFHVSVWCKGQQKWTGNLRLIQKEN